MVANDEDRELDRLWAEITACRICAEALPLGPRPVLRPSTKAPIRIVGQAPGTKVHESGVPWSDASGDRLRQWLAVDSDSFHDTRNFAIVPMGFCYPGRDARGGDLAPRPECAPAWQAKLAELMSQVGLTLLVGQYAQAWHLGKRRRRNLTETVRGFAQYGPELLPLPHPSWRTTGWAKRNPWFEAEVLPYLRARVAELIGAGE